MNNGTIIEPPSVEEICQMIKRHAKGLCEIKGEFTGIREMRKHFAWYTAGIKHAANRLLIWNSLMGLWTGYWKGCIDRQELIVYNIVTLVGFYSLVEQKHISVAYI